jgi:uncharacterized membrane protein YidH (DUF202 family)
MVEAEIGKRSTEELEQAKLAYTLLEQARELDDNLVWSRTNIMLVVQGVLITFFVQGLKESGPQFPLLMIVMGLFGLVSAVFFWHMTKGSVFWIAYWIDKLAAIEGDVLGPFEIYRNLPGSSPETIRKWKQKGYDYKSTGKTIVKLSVVFVVMWAVVLLLYGARMFGFL